MNDSELLERFARDGAQDAFRELVARHTNLVYACAAQRLRDPHAAQDVTQAVFVALALKAKSLRAGTPLAGWLYQAAKFACAKHQRAEERRKEHEMRAHEENAEPSAGEAKAVEEALPHLAPALDSLSASDRDAVLMRFYGNSSHQDVATTLGISEETARKRGNRALEKLRRFFAGRGVVLSAGAVASVLTTSAAQAAPAGLAAAATEAALAGVGGTLAATAKTVILAKGALKMMFMAKVQAAAVGTVAVVAAGTVAVTALQQVQTGAGKGDAGAAEGMTNVVLRQREIPVSARDAKGALYVAVGKPLLDGANQRWWDVGHLLGMTESVASIFRLTREEQVKFQMLMEETWKESDILERAFTVSQQGQTVTVELKGADGAELFAGLGQRLRTNFLAKVSQVLGPDRSEVLAWFTAGGRGVFPWPVVAWPTYGTTMYRMKLSRIQQGASTAIQLELDAEGELRVESGRALPSVDGKSKKFRVVETTASPFPVCWPALEERLGISRDSLTANVRSNRETYWARLDEPSNWKWPQFARFYRGAYRAQGEPLTPPPIGAESFSGDFRGVFVPVAKVPSISGLSWIAEPTNTVPGQVRYTINPAWMNILRLSDAEGRLLGGALQRTVEAMDRTCAEGLAVTRKSEDQIECLIKPEALAKFPGIFERLRAEATAAMNSGEKADIVRAFADACMPVQSPSAQLMWALYSNNPNALTKGTGIRVQRRQSGADERFTVTDLAPHEVQCIGAVDTDRSGLPAFLQGLWNASAAPVESEATKAAKVKFLEALRLLREEKLGESVAAFEVLRDQAEGLPDGLRSEIVYWLGESYFRTGDVEKARAAFKEVTVRHPDSNWAKYARGRLTGMPDRNRPPAAGGKEPDANRRGW